MTWLIWRQHRAEALALVVLIAAIGAALVIVGQPMHDLFPNGASRCVPPTTDRACIVGLATLQQSYDFAAPMLALLNFVPLAIGAFLGAPLLARELELGTWQLAWTQAVPRMRWLAAKLVALAGLTVALGAAFTGAVAWFRQPLDLFGRFDITGFDLSGIVPMAYGLFAFAIAALAGALLRRSLPAYATAIVVFVTVRIAVATWLRPQFRAPITLTQEIPPGSRELRLAAKPLDWNLGEGFADASGKHFSELSSTIWEHKATDAGIDPATYLHEHGILRWITYHPADRLAGFQLIESTLYVGLAALLLALLVWRVKRRAL
ncbi:transporter [Rhizocola hellebori]|uniref:Transporter n=1 Tax=Rhizocola hellebori TaxID=1392758 RepID=A0A8J3VGM0_9ACTN|nr:ABC transporter permease subunit [Rhizocola hellebori]GIH05277.1 transporter [Rhizocola hellebori]